jgi:hypothetical protein
MSRAFIDTFCTKRFRNKDFKEHWENILFEREQARMPETQVHVTRELEIQSMRTTYVYFIFLMSRVRTCTDLPERYRICFSTLLYEHIMALLEAIDILRHTTPTVHPAALAQKCPSGECRGFLQDDWVCGICRATYCEHCHGVLEDNHACDPDTVKTVKLLKRDTKPCPSCQAPIHRIEGCAQMWCTQCHTAFDWRTGHVVTGRIHNPHYFEFKQRSREHGDIPCGGRPTIRELRAAGASTEIIDIYTEVYRLDSELTYKYAYMYNDNLFLRVNYMMNRMSEDEFKRELQRRDKHNAKMRDIGDIYRMFIDTVGDLLRQFVLDPTKDILDETATLTRYTNGVIGAIQRRYVSRVPHFIMLDTTT